MTSLFQYSIAQTIADTGLVKMVFHSCQLLKNWQEQTLYPAYKKGAEWTYSGIDDAKGLFAYIRQNGDIVGEPLKIAGCSKAYNLLAPLRVVFFNDSEDRDFDTLLTKLSTFVFMSNVNLVRIITDKYRLVKEESSIFREKFDGKTFYIAFDINIRVQHLPSTCELEDCSTLQNPVKPCLVVAPGSSSFATS